MSQIIASHQILSPSTQQNPGSQHSLKRSYLAKKITRINELLNAYLAVLDKKTSEINVMTVSIDALHELDRLTAAQRKNLKSLIKKRSETEKWIMTSKLMNHIHELRRKLDVLNTSTMESHLF